LKTQSEPKLISHIIAFDNKRSSSHNLHYKPTHHKAEGPRFNCSITGTISSSRSCWISLSILHMPCKGVGIFSYH